MILGGVLSICRYAFWDVCEESWALQRCVFEPGGTVGRLRTSQIYTQIYTYMYTDIYLCRCAYTYIDVLHLYVYIDM